jgi:type I restriction enzyme S subunit
MSFTYLLGNSYMLILIAVSAATLYFGQFYLWTAQLSDDTNDKLGPAIEFRKNAFCMSQRLFAIRADKNKLKASYLYYELTNGHGYYQIQGSLSGSTVFGIRQDVLRTIKVVIPKYEIQDEFDKKVLPMLKKIKVIEKENLKLAELRDWLLPMLMNGQVKVN